MVNSSCAPQETDHRLLGLVQPVVGEVVECPVAGLAHEGVHVLAIEPLAREERGVIARSLKGTRECGALVIEVQQLVDAPPGGEQPPGRHRHMSTDCGRKDAVDRVEHHAALGQLGQVRRDLG